MPSNTVRMPMMPGLPINYGYVNVTIDLTGEVPVDLTREVQTTIPQQDNDDDNSSTSSDDSTTISFEEDDYMAVFTRAMRENIRHLVSNNPVQVTTTITTTSNLLESSSSSEDSSEDDDLTRRIYANLRGDADNEPATQATTAQSNATKTRKITNKAINKPKPKPRKRKVDATKKPEKPNCSVCYRFINKNNFWDVCPTAIEKKVPHYVCKFCIKKLMKRSCWPKCPLCRTTLLRNQININISQEKTERHQRAQERKRKAQAAQQQ